MAQKDQLTITIEKGKQRYSLTSPLGGIGRFRCCRQRPTQIASGAGKSSASGSNAAIDSKGTRQQQAVGWR